MPYPRAGASVRVQTPPHGKIIERLSLNDCQITLVRPSRILGPSPKPYARLFQRGQHESGGGCIKPVEQAREGFFGALGQQRGQQRFKAGCGAPRKGRRVQSRRLEQCGDPVFGVDDKGMLSPRVGGPSSRNLQRDGLGSFLPGIRQQDDFLPGPQLQSRNTGTPADQHQSAFTQPSPGPHPLNRQLAQRVAADSGTGRIVKQQPQRPVQTPALCNPGYAKRDLSAFGRGLEFGMRRHVGLFTEEIGIGTALLDVTQTASHRDDAEEEPEEIHEKLRNG